MKMGENTLDEYRRLITDAGVDKWVEQNNRNYGRLTKTQILTNMGKGITFLPSDIRSLQQHLRLFRRI